MLVTFEATCVRCWLHAACLFSASSLRIRSRPPGALFARSFDCPRCAVALDGLSARRRRLNAAANPGDEIAAADPPVFETQPGDCGPSPGSQHEFKIVLR